MKPSILRNLLFSYLAFGLAVALVFPFYANLFVNWKEGMLPWFVLGCIVAGIVIGLANYWLLSRILISRLRKIADVTNAISHKDLSQSCSIQSADTLGEIIASVNAMTGNLRSLLGEAASLGHEVGRGAAGVSVFINALTGDIVTQVERAEEISHAIDDLAGSVIEVSANSDSVAQLARQNYGTAQAGGEVVARAVSGMTTLSQTVARASSSLAELTADSDRIGGIIAVIRDIADQTNLLALNAAIEAARAGEQGRGFAVVADEVRKLAEKTAGATGEIGVMIKGIQERTADAVNGMQAGTDQMRDSVENVQDAGQAFSRIVSGAKEVASALEAIATANASQTETVKMIGRYLDDIAQIATEADARLRQGRAAVQGMAQSAQQLDIAVGSFRLA